MLALTTIVGLNLLSDSLERPSSIPFQASVKVIRQWADGLIANCEELLHKISFGRTKTLSMRGRRRAEASAILTPKIQRIQLLYLVQTSGWSINY